MLRIKPNAVGSNKIKNRSIQSEDLDSSSVTSRIIKNETIQGEDISKEADLEIQSLTVGEVFISGNSSIAGDIDMNGYIITNIGHAGTDFTATGGLNLNGTLVVDNTIQGTTLNTGQGAYELFAMDQNVLTTSNVTFNQLILTGTNGILKSSGGTISGSATTTDLPEGTNLYYTQARFDTAFGNKTTTNLNEGTNLYYLDSRSRTSISETVAGLTYDNTSGIFSLTAGYVIPTTTEETNWNTAYANRVDSWNYPLSFSSNSASLNYNATNLKLTSNELNTIQDITPTSTPIFGGLTLSGNLILGTNTLTTTNANLIVNLNADLLDGQQGTYYLNTGTNFGGDVSGTYNVIAIADDSHSHTATTLPLTTSYLGQTIESIEITDGTIAAIDLNPALSLLTGQTLSYGLGTLTANALDTTLTYGVNILGNSGTVTNGLYSTGTYNDPIWLGQLSGLKITSDISTNAVNVTGTVSVSNGGTGQTTAQAARNALLPIQTDNTNKFLQTDGTNVTWQNVLWSSLGAPASNLSLAMQSYTTTLTYGATTGANNLFNITDTINNTGTGYLVNITTANPSLLKPFAVSSAGGVFPAINVDNTGKVGIGWATPASQLTVVGGATFGVTYATDVLTDGKVAIENNLGIGTNNPLSKLDINGDLRLRPLTTAPAVQEGNVYYDGNDKNYKMYNSQTAEYIDLVADPHIQPSECPTGYIPVPGDARYGTAGGFCVMKYEAKCDDDADGEGDTTAQDATYKTWHNDTTACTGAGKAVVSSALGAPIAYISQITAKAYCSALGNGYHLITNNEWMTMARNIDRITSNWTSGTVGTAGIWRGHTDGTPGNALEANVDDAQGYEGTGNAAPSIEKRTFTLSNGQMVWDLSGNVWEWNQDTIKRKDQPHSTTAPDNTFGYKELNTFDNYGSMSYAAMRPSNPAWTSAHNMGRVYTYNPSGDVNTTQYAFLHGGYWTYTTHAGLFSLGLLGTPASTAISFGFRCVFAP